MTPEFDNLVSLLMEMPRQGKKFPPKNIDTQLWAQKKDKFPDPWPSSTVHHINWIPCDQSPENVILLPHDMHISMHQIGNAGGAGGADNVNLAKIFEHAWNNRFFSRLALMDMRNKLYGPFPRIKRGSGKIRAMRHEVIQEPYGIPYNQTTHAGQLNVNDENEKQRKWTAISNYTNFNPLCKEDILLLPGKQQQKIKASAPVLGTGRGTKERLNLPEEFWANLPPKPPEE